ncbi:putative dehydrogenase [Fontibacillus phaseoli]|uniref:Putative dehydrogenase n=1 Tax=Fontibacillus phaseoli TaxID=1416533 RepID=A0A369BHA3_9BACL|nr:Gfo/Idh/MocA family oxidoreductase [Fontibacillus phaseoli]RCX19064.1 putative dehydrogenase [Fontibacillus phaseoli]
MVKKIGIIGLSEGNGHPYSFSAIVNGYNDIELKKSGWNVIYDYVTRRDPSEFGFSGFQITYAWTQNKEITDSLCNSCRIPNSMDEYEEMAGLVDGVIIARDDYESHYEIAKFFLEKNIPVFIDKPLTLNVTELRYFKPFLENGKLMSCSGMRYAKEVDQLRQDIITQKFDHIKLIRGTVIHSWEKYGIHLIDAILNLASFIPESVQCIESEFESMAITMSDGTLVQIDALGPIPLAFHIDVYGSQKITKIEISDNFSMFRRTLWHFFHFIESGKPAIPAYTTINAMRILMAGQLSKKEKRRVAIDEFSV